MKNKEKFVRQLFNSIAPRYDLLNTLLSFGLHYFWKKRAVKILQIQDEEKVIDVCGGTGDLAILAAKDIQNKGRIFLYDFSRPMIEKSRRKAGEKLSPGRIYFVQGDAQRISLGENEFAAAMVGFGLRNLADIKEGLREIYRVLKPGGKLVALEFSQPRPKWFRLIFDFYAFHIIPWAGSIISGSKEAYLYLPASIKAFPSPEAIKALLAEVGFAEVNYLPLTMGVAVIYRAIKPCSPC